MLKIAYRSVIPQDVRQRAHELRSRGAAAINSAQSSLQKPQRFLRRIGLAAGYFRSLPHQIIRWAARSREDSNFTYDLTPQNRAYLASFIAVVAGIDTGTAARFIAEPEDIRGDIARRLIDLEIPGMDPDPHFGRRLGWYALARAMKPRVIVETGVEHGLGSVLLCAALKRNTEEGFPGRYYGTDIRPTAGELFGAPWTSFGKILYGDSTASLADLEETVDLFINDSDHSADYEYREYLVIAPKLSERGIILGDNAHVTDKLLNFSIETDRKFLFFREQPRRHWYPGGGIGVSFR